MANKLHGIFCVAVTAMTEDQEVNEAAYRQHIRFLLDAKVHVIVPCGSTGEVAVLSEEERKKVVDIAIDEVAGRVPVVVGAAACSTRDVIRHSQYAEKAGAAAVLLVHPYYSAPSEREMDEHLKAVAESIHIPAIIYNNPFSTHYDMLPAQLARLSTVPNLSYVKESSGSIKRVSEILGLCGERMTVLCGDDMLPFESFALGAKGWVAVTANVFPRQCVELYELAVVKKDYEKARQLWFRLLPFVSMVEGSGKFVQYAKAACEIQGRPVGPPRGPFLRPSAEEIRALREAMAAVAA